MKVLVLSRYDDCIDGYEVIGVFSSKEKLPAYTLSKSYDYQTQEFEIDEVQYG